MTPADDPELIFPTPFDERREFEARSGGWVGAARVRTADGAIYAVTFYDQVRLAQDLEYEVSTGRMCIAEHGLIILPEVTLENMQTAIRALADEGYFGGLRPLAD